MSVDMAVHFFIRAHDLLRASGYTGLLGRRSINEGINRDVGLSQIIAGGSTIYSALTDRPWPGKAAVVVHQIHITKGAWSSERLLNRSKVVLISDQLTDTTDFKISVLRENLGRIFRAVF